MSCNVNSNTTPAILVPNLLQGKPGHLDDNQFAAYKVTASPADYRSIFQLSTDSEIVKSAIPFDAMIPGGYGSVTLRRYMEAFGNPNRIKEEFGTGVSPIDYLGTEWNPAQQMKMYRTSMIQQANWIMLNHLRDCNRILLNDLERMNPIDSKHPQDSVMLNLAQATHQSWLQGEKSKSYYVEYTQEVHDALTQLCVEKKLMKPGQNEVMPLDLLLNPKKKWKFTAKDIRAENNDPAVVRLEMAMNKSITSDFRINTVASEWENAIGIKVSDDWSSKRPGYLYGLQADSVASVYACLCDDTITNPLIHALETSDIQLIQDSIVDILRAINVGWRVNNAWGGWNDPLQNRPFGMSDIGGIGIEDIERDALVLKPILEILEAARMSGRLSIYPKIGTLIQKMFSLGISTYLESMTTNKEQLMAAVSRNQTKYL